MVGRKKGDGSVLTRSLGGDTRWEEVGEQFRLDRLSKHFTGGVTERLEPKDMECKEFSWEPEWVTHRSMGKSLAFRVPVPSKLLAKP